MLPPGRAKLTASPLAIGSSPMKDITIGTVEDASLTARIATVETATTTSGLVAIASRASSGIRVGGPTCVVDVRLRPSTKPSRASSATVSSETVRPPTRKARPLQCDRDDRVPGLMPTMAAVQRKERPARIVSGPSRPPKWGSWPNAIYHAPIDCGRRGVPKNTPKRT